MQNTRLIPIIWITMTCSSTSGFCLKMMTSETVFPGDIYLSWLTNIRIQTSFRGATHESIMAFPKMFPECKIIKLEENYRSTQSILNVANAVLENMKNKYSKCLVSAKKKTGQKPRLLFFKDAY